VRRTAIDVAASPPASTGELEEKQPADKTHANATRQKFLNMHHPGMQAFGFSSGVYVHTPAGLHELQVSQFPSGVWMGSPHEPTVNGDQASVFTPVLHCRQLGAKTPGPKPGSGVINCVPRTDTTIRASKVASCRALASDKLPV
jgi:hypothetical protein